MRTLTALLALAAATSAQVGTSASFRLDGLELDAAGGGASASNTAAFTQVDGSGAPTLSSSGFQAEVGFLAVHDAAAGAAPAIFALTPNYGVMEGGDPFAIHGQGFIAQGAAGSVAVTVGGVPATNVILVSDTRIDAVAPAGSSGPHDLAVTTLLGTGVASDGFVHTPAVVTSPVWGLGSEVEILNLGYISGFFDMWYSNTTTFLPIPPFGVLEIGPVPLLQAYGVEHYPAPDGVHVTKLSVPLNPGLVGTPLHFQSIAFLSLTPPDIRLTNKASIVYQ